MSRDLTNLRESYQRAGLRRATLAADPIHQFEIWWDEWAATEPYDAAACVLATADAAGRPAARFVLLRGVDAAGFVIYTNQRSAKARDIEANPQASLTFGWLELARQVRVEGPVAKVDDATADAYWAERPRAHQLGAWASEQSTPVPSRAELDARLAEVEARFGTEPDGAPVPRPPHWGGYRIRPERIELWQGQPGRLHDRFEYRRDGDAWRIQRLAP